MTLDGGEKAIDHFQEGIFAAKVLKKIQVESLRE